MSEKTEPRGQLLRILGLAFGLAAVVGSVIGQGILRSPGVVAEATGSPTLIIGLWIAAALISCLTAFAFAELGAAIPSAGGPYAFLHRAFGPQGGLLAALTLIVSLYAALAYMCYVVGEFLVRLGVGGGEVEPQWFGIGLLAVLAVINGSGTRISGASQILLSSVKGLVLIGLVIALFASPGAVPTAPEPVLREGWLPLGTALVVVLTTFGGWWSVVLYGEEIEDPGRRIPRAILGGILGVGTLYVFINLAMLHVMTPQEMAGSSLVAADAAGVVFGTRAEFALTCFGVLSVGAIANMALMNYTRFTYAIARAGILPRALAVVGRRGTPIRAMMTVVIAAAVLMLSGGYLALVTMSETIFLPIVIAVQVAVIVLRRREPDLVRPYRVPLYPVPLYAAIAVLGSLLVIYIVQDPFYSLAGFALVGALWLGYRLLAPDAGRIEQVSAEDLR